MGGVEDHVHVLARLGRTITQADWIKDLKRVSSRWLHEQAPEFSEFAWQGGYADFSVSQSNPDQEIQYVAGQENHHRKMTYKDEVRALLRKRNQVWDERYIWD